MTRSQEITKMIQQNDLRRLKEEMKTNLNKELSLKDESNRVPLHWAASFGQEEIVQWLLESGSEVDPVDDAGWTPLIIASSGGKVRVVELLLSCGAQVDARTDQGRTAVFYACSRNRLEVAKRLCPHSDINISDIFGVSPLHRAVGTGHYQIVEYLLSNYLNVLELDRKDNEGDTALHTACKEGNLEIVDLLLRFGFNPSIVNKAGKTSIEVADSKSIEAIRRCFARHATPI